MSRRNIIPLASMIFASSLFLAKAQTAPNRYTLILADPPVAERFPEREAMRSKAAVDYQTQLRTKQRTLREELAKRKIQVTGSVDTLLNAVFVVAPKERLAELKSLPGVKAVVPGRRYHMEMNRATQLLNAPQAWNTLGGLENAGSGVKIAILDSGIDQTHPAFQDAALSLPAGFPICTGSDCAYTSNKVIVARSYVRQLAAGSSPNPAADSRPDDYSPRDRDGHGTAVASCAAADLNSGLVSFTGIAPKAYLGNYKIYGSPGVNDSTADDVILQALEDAFLDGMDVVNFSSGGPAFSGPLDSGSVCGNDAGVPCDLVAQTFETLAQKGLIIVAAAGNEGADGVNPNLPSYNTISSPADAPSVIAAGAVTNSHSFLEVVSAAGTGAPSSLTNIPANPGDGFVPPGTITAPLIDITQIGNDGYACSALPAASLVGAIALIERNNCTFSTKMGNAEDAGALGVIFYMADTSAPISPTGLSSFPIPGVMISNASGVALKSYANSSSAHPLSIIGPGIEQNDQPDEVASFSSLGPTTGDGSLKPDLLAVGTRVYMAGENYDLNGVLYSSDRYVVADGTSFATPMVAGAAALVRQQHPGFTSAQVKSALANSAAASVQVDTVGDPVDVRSVGAGLLDVGAAVNTVVTAVPSSVSFGVLTSLPRQQSIQLTNTGTGTLTLAISIAVGVASSAAGIQVDQSSMTLDPGATGTFTVSVRGSLPRPGSYSGTVLIQGDGTSLRIPYLYMVGGATPANLIPLTGTNFDGTVGGGIPDGIISFKLVDVNGVPVAGAPVLFGARGGTLQGADTVTDQNGLAGATPVLGTVPGAVTYTAAATGLRAVFSGYARPQPLISSGGIVDGASLQPGRAVAPGSSISIIGTGLSDFTDYAESATLPLAIDEAFVSFDVPSAGISVPGHLQYVSPDQIKLQVPWELQGQSSAQVKVTIDYSTGNVVTLALADYAPSFFEGAGGLVAAIDQNGSPVTAGNPARRGQAVSFFANGLGPVTNQPASGDPAAASPAAATTTVPAVTIGGQGATVTYSGLAPGYVGLYRIDATVPAGLNAGTQSISVAIGGATSPSASLPVQ